MARKSDAVTDKLTTADAADKKAKKKARGKRAWKATGGTVGALVGIATAKGLDATWKTATGRKPPNKPESPEIAGREALLWAALSGMAMGLAKTYATRRVAAYWVRSFGELPPGMSAKSSDAEGSGLDKKDRKALKKLAAGK